MSGSWWTTLGDRADGSGMPEGEIGDSAPVREGSPGGGRAPTRRWMLYTGLGLLALGAYYESRTSAFQAWVFSRWARQASYTVASGQSQEVVYPIGGPHDVRLGYTRLGEFRRRLERHGFETTEQARFSPTLARLVRWGFSPPFREPADAGLEVRDSRGKTVFDFAQRRPRFDRFEEIPLPIVRSLLYIEDRRLGDEGETRRNPVVDWGRFAGAGARYVGRKVGLPLRVEGGSTLATQMEKYRHSAGGRTDSPVDKLKQMTSATLRIYRDGPDTSERRRQVVLDYLNSVPLAAARGYGEVHGLGEGLRVWFGLELDDVRRELERPGADETQARMFKHVAALIYSVRAPSRFLLRDRKGLALGVNSTLRLLRTDGVVDAQLVDRALEIPLSFSESAPAPPPPLGDGKASSEIRHSLGEMLNVSDFYVLDRLHIEADATIDSELQQRAATLFSNLADPAFVKAEGLRDKRLIETSDPARVIYSLLLIEATDRGNLVRLHADNFPGPFDVNSDMKMELGSTAKLRTLVHYLDLVAGLHRDFSGLAQERLRGIEREARDPITRWAATTLLEAPTIDADAFLQRALDRRYSASPWERFFTGGGMHTFRNFDEEDDSLVPTVREATVRSTNLAFVRLMRDIVRFHEARLPYDMRAILDDPDNPERKQLLESIVDEEGRTTLHRAWQRFHTVKDKSVVAELLGRRSDSDRHLAIVYFAWHPGGDPAGLLEWLHAHGKSKATSRDAERLTRSYGAKELTLSDAAWLADVVPLDLWCAGRLVVRPDMTWDELLAESAEARRASSEWLFKTKNRKAQDVRLRTRLEQEAFHRITAFWKRLGFPFARMVPSYASAIGSSADRPVALAELMGILVNDGVRRPSAMIEEVRLAPGTPYYAELRSAPPRDERVLPAEVARATRGVLVSVVEKGTARRVNGAFTTPGGEPIVVGGKTGSGDNQRGTFSRDGARVSSEAINRTAAFVFFLGDRHFGVITAMVDGPEAAEYRFTSSLPLAVLRLLAPEIVKSITTPPPANERQVAAMQASAPTAAEPVQAAAAATGGTQTR